MEFDFDNFEKYINKPVSRESIAKIAKMDAIINEKLLNEKELKFVEDVRKRIRNERPLTEKQRAWLAKILQKCQQI